MFFLFALMSVISATKSWVTVEGDDSWKPWKTYQVNCPERTNQHCYKGNTCAFADSYGATCFAVQVECLSTDYGCRARELCSLITGEECLYQDFSCMLGFGGSYYVPSIGPGSWFSFAISYDFLDSDGKGTPYGNICDCSSGNIKMAPYGLNIGFRSCGVGHWYRYEYLPSTDRPTDRPSSMSPTDQPSSMSPTDQPSSMSPTDRPSFMPSMKPTKSITMAPVLTTAPSMSPLQTSSIAGSSSTNTTLIYIVVASLITIFCCLLLVCYLSIKLKAERKLQHGGTATMIEGGEGL